MNSVESFAAAKALDQSQGNIFFEKPGELLIDEDVVTKSSSSQVIETLIEELKEKGPLVALGQMGPRCYGTPPFQLKNKLCNVNIYGWKPHSERTSSEQSYAIVLGAKKLEDREYVYFTMSDDTTLNQSTYIRKHQPSFRDTKIYVVSHKTFRNYLFDLYPPAQPPREQPIFFISSRPKNCPTLSPSEKIYAEKLCSISPLSSILDRDEGESKCKAIGQEIFNKYKQDNGGNSLAGKDAVQRICNAVTFLAADGSLRKQYIEHAWDGIGDNNWRWLA